MYINQSRRKSGRRKKWRWSLGLLLALLVVLAFALDFKAAYQPDAEDLMNPVEWPQIAYDFWGVSLSQEEWEQFRQHPDYRAWLTEKNGAVTVDQNLIEQGEAAFYKETFGNEVFLTDILGVIDGPIGLTQFAQALLDLGGAGTTNLRVKIPESVTIGGQTFAAGSYLDTGVDVPQGSYMPIGLVTRYAHGVIRTGISCALCHSTLDPETLQVIHGAPNADFNAGAMLAFASNSAAYFTHTEIGSVTEFITPDSPTARFQDGSELKLPEAKRLEDRVDAILLSWSPGNFDSTIDQQANPCQIPDSFTFGDHPFAWSGFALAGPFRGLSAFSNNVHAQNSDSLSQAHMSRTVFNMDAELYYAVILQNAARSTFRYRPDQSRKPSEVFREADPNPYAPGVNHMIKPPSHPLSSLIAPDGNLISLPHERVFTTMNAIAAWQDAIVPPPATVEADASAQSRGRQIFEQSCISCHAGPAFTHHRVVPAPEIGTQPSRAQALKKIQRIFQPIPLIHSFNTEVPPPNDAEVLQVPYEHLDPRQLELAWAFNDSPGGYKTPSLLGLYWTAPYLHDGGVAVGADAETQGGLPGTLHRQIPADPAHSLLALIDRRLRERVIQANQADARLRTTRVTGEGHAFWIDEAAGFTPDDQQALIQYLLTLPMDRAAIRTQFQTEGFNLETIRSVWRN